MKLSHVSIQNIHKMLFVGDCDWDEKSVSSLQEIKADAIKKFAEQVIGELEVFQRSSEDDYAGLGYEDDFGAMNAYGHAIEIVKQRLDWCAK